MEKNHSLISSTLHSRHLLSSRFPTNSPFAGLGPQPQPSSPSSIITTLLITSPYVIVILLDSRKAFGTVRHSTLVEKMARLNIPTNAHNWLVDFSAITQYCVPRWEIKYEVNSSQYNTRISHTASYVVIAGDLNAVTPRNRLVKLADDTYRVIPAGNVDSRTAKIRNV